MSGHAGEEGSMSRRNLFKLVIASVVGVSAARTAGLAAAAAPPRQKVVYHLSDVDRIGFTLGNIENHVSGTGGPGGADIVLVINGPALKAFHTMGGDPKLAERMTRLIGDKVAFDACANTMRAQKVELDDLLPGFTVAMLGGVVRIAELQAQGYAYIRP